MSIGEPWMWAAFIIFVIAMLALDLFVFGGRKAQGASRFGPRGAGLGHRLGQSGAGLRRPALVASERHARCRDRPAQDSRVPDGLPD